MARGPSSPPTGEGLRNRHRVFVSSEFFHDHTVEEIRKLLGEWHVLDRLKHAGARAVIVTNSGIEVVGT